MKKFLCALRGHQLVEIWERWCIADNFGGEFGCWRKVCACCGKVVK